MADPTGPRNRAFPWPKSRTYVEDLLAACARYPASAVGEVDITATLLRIKAVQRELRQGISLHGYVLYCVAQAVNACPEVQTYRHGRKLVVMGVVDVGTIVERRIEGGYRVPRGYTVRDAGTKTHAQIQQELRQAARGLEPVKPIWRWLAPLPGFARRLAWRMVQSNPEWHRRYMMGTVGLTSVQIPGLDAPFTAIVPTAHTLTMAMGSLVERVALDEGGRPQRRRVLMMSGTIDHRVIDGMTAARFGRELATRLGGAIALDERFVAEMRAGRESATA